ncbi:MAG: hypothetical protein LBN34_07100 [Clostridiales Family XIII bacterium]|jgi:hypothetical protein|nr:hypothetical protein [Clostridiales Family XIII bacterium]
MAQERYQRVGEITAPIYSQDCSVLIMATSILLDTQTGNAMAQIKYKSLSENVVKAIFVDVQCFDVSGNELDGIVDFQYLDLNIGSHNEFGSKTPIKLPDSRTRRIIVKIRKIMYQVGGLKELPENAEWKTVPKQENLIDSLGSPELVEQYIRETSISSKFTPLETDNIWLCSCGEVNSTDEAKCHQCSINKKSDFDNFNKELLIENLNEYRKSQLVKENLVANKKSKIKKIAIITLAIAVLIILTTLIIGFINTQKQPGPDGEYSIIGHRYNTRTGELLDSGTSANTWTFKDMMLCDSGNNSHAPSNTPYKRTGRKIVLEHSINTWAGGTIDTLLLEEDGTLSGVDTNETNKSYYVEIIVVPIH